MSSKTALRRRLRTARSRLDAAEQISRAERLTGVLTAHIRPSALVAAYRPMTGEPDVAPFLAAHRARGGTVLLPRIVPGPERRLEWVPWTPETTMRRSRQFPIDEPAGDPVALDVSRDVDVLLVPALAVGRDGVRLGQGGGYYDRLLGPGRGAPDAADEHAGAEQVAVVHPEELLPAGEIPAEPHDLLVDRAVTAHGLVHLDAIG